MSIEDVEKIMDETKEAVEYQNVSLTRLKHETLLLYFTGICTPLILLLFY